MGMKCSHGLERVKSLPCPQSGQADCPTRSGTFKMETATGKKRNGGEEDKRFGAITLEDNGMVCPFEMRSGRGSYALLSPHSPQYHLFLFFVSGFLVSSREKMQEFLTHYASQGYVCLSFGS